MKKPAPPPDTTDTDTSIATEKFRGAFNGPLLKLLNDAIPQDKPYPHWDQLQHLTPPGGIRHQEWWQWLKFQRQMLYKAIPLSDDHDQPFQFALTDRLLQYLHRVDQKAGGRIGVAARVTTPETQDIYYVSSLMEEAITSSQLEGAMTTRRVAKELLQTQRAPVDKSERMILNNYRTMRRVSELQRQPLTCDLVFELHRITTEETLDDVSAAGRFRRDDEDIVVQDNEGNVFHTPPPAAGLSARMQAMCDFANGLTPDYFLHPVLRAVILHFWLAYDHPFVDGNGRTARALFYWSMLRDGYWLCEYLSISRILKQAPAKYSRAFLYTETDDNDLTYFVLYHLEVLQRAIKELHEYLAKKAAQQKAVEQRLQSTMAFNHRQRALIGHALRHPGFRYTIEGHRVSHNIVYQTARTDLLDLAKWGVLEKRQAGKAFYFTPAPGLETKLQG